MAETSNGPPDGSVVVHRLSSRDSTRYEAFLVGLDPETRRERFCGAVADDTVRHYARTVRRRGAVLFGAFEGGRLCGVAELVPDGAGTAEAALAVAPASRRRGVGTLLMGGMRLAAVNRGVRLLRVVCLTSNRAMSRLALNLKARSCVQASQFLAEIALPVASPATLAGEAAAEGFARLGRYLQTVR